MSLWFCRGVGCYSDNAFQDRDTSMGPSCTCSVSPVDMYGTRFCALWKIRPSFRPWPCRKCCHEVDGKKAWPGSFTLCWQLLHQLWPDSCCPEEPISVEPWSVTGDSLQTLSPKQNYVLVMVNHYFWEHWLLIIWMVVLRNFHFLGDSFRMLHILVINVLFILLLHQLFYLPEECHLMKLYAMPFWYLIMH